MYSRRPAKRKRNRPERANHHNRPHPRLLSRRSAFILQLAAMAAAGTAFLLHLAHDPWPLIVLGGFGAFATAAQLFDQWID